MNQSDRVNVSKRGRGRWRPMCPNLISKTRFETSIGKGYFTKSQTIVLKHYLQKISWQSTPSRQTIASISQSNDYGTPKGRDAPITPLNNPNKVITIYICFPFFPILVPT